MNKDTFRILAQGQMMNNNTCITGLNNNDLIIGPSGAGKTRGYVKPNLLQCNESFVVTDTKGNLIRQVGPILRKNGYKIVNIDFTRPEYSYGYNPLDYIRYDEKKNKYCERDIMTVTNCIVTEENLKEPFWDQAAKMYLACMIAYVLETGPKEEHTLEYVNELITAMENGAINIYMEELKSENPDSFAARKFFSFCGIQKADKMHASICGIVAEKLDALTYDAFHRMYERGFKIDFRKMGQEKTAVFLTVSDTDRSADKLVNLFYTQALQELCDSADRDYPDNRLKVPVRLILDDFATNAFIPDFDKIISVIRSREIYVSIILQSISQLEGLYGHAKAMTIINNCDNCLYLGGQDVETAKYMGIKANKSTNTILNMSLSDAYLFTRGCIPKKVQKYDLTTHEKYNELPEASQVISHPA